MFLEAHLFKVSLSFHSPCTSHPQLCIPVPFGICLSHICSKCLAGMETSYPFHWVWNSFHGPYHPCGCLLQTVWTSYPSYFWWIFHTGCNSPLQSLSFCLNDAVWRLPAWLSPLLSLVSLYVPLSQPWP